MKSYCYSDQCCTTDKKKSNGMPRRKDRVQKEGTGNCPDCSEPLVVVGKGYMVGRPKNDRLPK